MLVVDKTNQIKEVQPFESYLIPNPRSARLKYYNDVVSVLYTECFTDFSSTERFQHYLIAERSWRFEIESVLNSLASKVDEIKSNSANSDSGHSYDIHSKVTIYSTWYQFWRCFSVWKSYRCLGENDEFLSRQRDCQRREKIFIVPPF